MVEAGWSGKLASQTSSSASPRATADHMQVILHVHETAVVRQAIEQRTDCVFCRHGGPHPSGLRSDTSTRSETQPTTMRLAGGKSVLCGLRLDAAEKRRARGLPVRATPVVFHLSLALAALAVGRQNALAARESARRVSATRATAKPWRANGHRALSARGVRTLPSGLSAGVRRACTSKSRRRRQIRPEGDGREPSGG